MKKGIKRSYLLLKWDVQMKWHRFKYSLIPKDRREAMEKLANEIVDEIIAEEKEKEVL